MGYMKLMTQIPFNDSRAVSLLISLSKIVEKIVHNQLLNILGVYDILLKNQFPLGKLVNLYGHDDIFCWMK